MVADLGALAGGPTTPIYTIGYAGRSLAEVRDLLVQRGIWLLVDVRRAPFSRAWQEFNRPNLQMEFEAMYRPMPALGNRKEAGERWEPSSPEKAERALRQLAALVKQGVVIALLCAEIDAQRCHRREVAARLSSLTGRPVEHL